jgi:hypothetical protein
MSYQAIIANIDIKIRCYFVKNKIYKTKKSKHNSLVSYIEKTDVDFNGHI